MAPELIDDPKPAGMFFLQSKLFCLLRGMPQRFSACGWPTTISRTGTRSQIGRTFAVSVLLLAGILLAGGPLFREKIRGASAIRILIVIAFLFLSLPWGEWLHLNIALSRQNWSRLLFEQTLYVYAMVSLLRLFPDSFPGSGTNSSSEAKQQNCNSPSGPFR